MSKSAIYIVNNTTQDVAINGTINPGTIIRRFGQGIGLAGNGIQINGNGYYSINTDIVLSAADVGEVTVTLFKNGEPVPGAIATKTIMDADEVVTLPIDALIRQVECCYSPGPASLTFVVTGVVATVTNIASVIIKL